MTRSILLLVAVAGLAGMAWPGGLFRRGAVQAADRPGSVALPAPHAHGGMGLDEALARRRSVRGFASKALTLEQVAQLLWAAQGITHDDGARTAPSAGGLHPLEVVLVVGSVEQLPAGVYRYLPREHRLAALRAGDARTDVSRAALNQMFVARAPVAVVIAAVYERTSGKYGQRGIRYAHLEAGHAAQNVCLEAAALGLGSVVIGAFEDEALAGVLGLGSAEHPLELLALGYPG